ncbi:hypothetical protein, partial [Escherichia coli]|uniref:hypothetical protein n=1 Tax=Escherichia coli TaxID=562 RepID=UPI001F4BA1E6
LMELTVHFNAEQDLDRLFEKDEEAVGYLENVIAMIQADSAIFDGLYKNRYFREYGEPIGPIDVEVKPILPLWGKDVKV